MSKKLYIAYGSNLNLKQMARRCPTAVLVGTGVVNGYELQFKGVPDNAFATIGEKEGASVPVAVWELEPRDEMRLNVYEGYPTHYFKKNISVTINGKEISGMAYIMNLQAEFNMPSFSYLKTIRDGYKDCGLDLKALQRAFDETEARLLEQSESDEDFGEDEDEDLSFDSMQM